MTDSLMKLRLIVSLLIAFASLSFIYLLWKTFSEKQLESQKEIKPFRTTWGIMGKEEADQTIFRPNGFWLRENGEIPSLEYMDLPNCSMVFAEWLNRAKRYNSGQEVPTKIPKLLKDKYTFNGLIQFAEDVEENKTTKNALAWTRSQIEELILKDIFQFDQYKGEERAMLRAMKNQGVNGYKLYVFGATDTPWIEAFALKEGILEITRTAPVNITIQDYPYVKYENSFDIARNYHRYMDQYDYAAAFSIEDFGFAKRDSLNPFGDLLEINKAYCMLKDKGILFLGLPVGWDTVMWNSKRIYGRLRIAMLAAAFDVIDMFHYDESVAIKSEEFDDMKPGTFRRVVLVLQKRHTTSDWF